jgi:hypothetical protein
MIPVYQTRFAAGPRKNGVNGNCTQATIASIFELPLDEVPDFRSTSNGWQVEKIRQFARTQGYDYRVLPSASVYPPDGYHTISGVSPRGVRHLVVGYKGKIVHDPHPDGGGVVIDKYGFFVPLSVPLVLPGDRDKITQIGFRDTTTRTSSPSETHMPFDSRSLVGGLLGALVVGGVAAYTAKGKVRVPWVPLAAGAVGGALAATYATSALAAPQSAGVGAVSLSEVKDAKRRAKIATAEAREAREQTEVARGQRRQERERAKKGLTSIDVAQSEESAKREGYDVALMEGRADQFDDSENEDEDEGASAGVGRISIGRVRDLSIFSAGGDDDDDDDDDGDDDDDDDGDDEAPVRARRGSALPREEMSLPDQLAAATTSTQQRPQGRPGQQRPGQQKPGQQKARPGQQRPGPQQARPGQQRPGPQQRPPQQRPPQQQQKPQAAPEEEFPVLGFSNGGGPPAGGGMMGMFGGGK